MSEPKNNPNRPPTDVAPKQQIKPDKTGYPFTLSDEAAAKLVAACQPDAPALTREQLADLMGIPRSITIEAMSSDELKAALLAAPGGTIHAGPRRKPNVAARIEDALSEMQASREDMKRIARVVASVHQESTRVHLVAVGTSQRIQRRMGISVALAWITTAIVIVFLLWRMAQ